LLFGDAFGRYFRIADHSGTIADHPALMRGSPSGVP
jgi:hypothetical protein